MMQALPFAELPSFAFDYGRAPSQTLLPDWQDTRSSSEAPNAEATRLTWLDPTTDLQVTATVTRFRDFPALEWVIEFENLGAADTPIIENILPLDLSIPLGSSERVRLHHANGSLCQMDDWLPQLTEMRPGVHKTLSPLGGRSSNGVCPFVNIQGDGGGLVLAIGWSGQWTATFERTEQALHVTAGMTHTHLRLHPGEKIRTPRILLLAWEGDDMETGNNLLRQLLLARYLPRLQGELILPPTGQFLQMYFYLTNNAGEQYEMKALPKTAATGAEVHWIDACWFGGEREWWQEVGTWTVNPQKFPRGLRPISDAAHAAGLKFVLWFEPERVRPGTLIHREHPQYLLSSDQNPDNMLFNLGMPEARRYMTDTLSAAIVEHGVDVYRQDFNFDPLPYWQAADAPDRIGMTEIRYIEGFYELWDELLRRNPHLWIDNCASGGRRIDVETLTRSLPLWPSDFHDTIGLQTGMGLHVGDQCINAGLARWVPLFGGGVWNFTPYGTRSEIIGGFCFGFHIDHKDFPSDDVQTVVKPLEVMAKGKTLLDDDFPMDAARASIAEWRSIRPFFLGDFHQLVPLTISYHDWCAWQLHRPDMAAGVAVFLRRHRSPFPTMTLALKQIDPDAQYDVSLSPDYTEAPCQRMSGAELIHLPLTIPEAPGSLLLRYTRV
jgi:alpha-galactosidase